jgi:ribonucleoside-diphosphate reductase alpha chain
MLARALLVGFDCRGTNGQERLSVRHFVEKETEVGTVTNLVPSEGTVAETAEKTRVPAVEATEQKDLFLRAQRQKLPEERNSLTHKFSVAGHEGYITVGMYAGGRPGEVFIKMAKEGSTLSGVMDGLALALSIGLQYGVPLKVLVDKLINMRFEPSGITENPEIRFASSLLDYVGRWLGGKFISRDYLKLGTGTTANARPTPVAAAANSRPAPTARPPVNGGEAPSCSTCGMLMVPNGSCYKCVNCGSTSGCS